MPATSTASTTRSTIPSKRPSTVESKRSLSSLPSAPDGQTEWANSESDGNFDKENRPPLTKGSAMSTSQQKRPTTQHPTSKDSKLDASSRAGLWIKQDRNPSSRSDRDKRRRRQESKTDSASEKKSPSSSRGDEFTPHSDVQEQPKADPGRRRQSPSTAGSAVPDTYRTEKASETNGVSRGGRPKWNDLHNLSDMKGTGAGDLSRKQRNAEKGETTALEELARSIAPDDRDLLIGMLRKIKGEESVRSKDKSLTEDEMASRKRAQAESRASLAKMKRKAKRALPIRMKEQSLQSSKVALPDRSTNKTCATCGTPDYEVSGFANNSVFAQAVGDALRKMTTVGSLSEISKSPGREVYKFHAADARGVAMPF